MILRKSQIDGGYWIVNITLDDGFSINRGYFDNPDLDDDVLQTQCYDYASLLREMRIQDGRYKALVQEQEQEDKERSYGSGVIHDAEVGSPNRD